LFGLIRIAFAAHPSKDRCALESTERWTWVNNLTPQFVPRSEQMKCVDNGCTAVQGTCPATPPQAYSSPINVGDQNGDGQDDLEYLYVCPCGGENDPPDGVDGGGYCETLGVKKSWVPDTSPGYISIRCLRIFCAYECETTETIDPPNPWPDPYTKTETCKCP
jgi:hypothetical protein